MIGLRNQILLCMMLTFLAVTASFAQLSPLPALTPDQGTVIIVPATAAPAATPAAIPGDLPGQLLYDGGGVGDLGIGLAPWGGGSSTIDSTHSVDTGKSSVAIESPGFYQGGGLTFGQPISLGSIADTTKYLQLTLQLTADPKYPPPAPTDQIGPGGPMGGYGGGSPQGGYGSQQGRGQTENFNNNSMNLFHLAQGYPQPGGNPNQFQQGSPTGQGNPAQGYPGQPPMGGVPGGQQGALGYQPDDEPAPPALPAKTLHVLLTFADGTQTDIGRVLPTLAQDQDWFTVGVPLSKLIVAGSTQPSLTSLTLATDNPTIINVGRLKLVTDSAPITADAGGDKDISANEEAVFNANANGGASTLSYKWDFDTQGAFTAEADGPRATHTYTTSGNYIVTLVVTDVDGIKAPVTVTAKVHVEQ